MSTRSGLAPEPHVHNGRHSDRFNIRRCHLLDETGESAAKRFEGYRRRCDYRAAGGSKRFPPALRIRALPWPLDVRIWLICP
jgi:hypothetical protein